MLFDAIGTLPAWLLAGVLLGGALALGSAAVFAVGVRLFPDGAAGVDGPEGGERRRRAEIRRYLAKISEPYREDYPIAGRPAAFFLPEREVAITFDARDYFRFERAGVHAVLLEYELPGAHLGSRLPFETPDSDPDPDPDPDPDRGPGSARGGPRGSTGWSATDASMDTAGSAFATLGLGEGATEADVRAAYRDRVKDVHPDHGGDIDAFRRLQRAYALARERAE